MSIRLAINLNMACTQRSHFMTVLDAELKIHEQLQPSIEHELEIMDRVEAMLLTNIGTNEAKQLMAALEIAGADEPPLDSEP